MITPSKSVTAFATIQSTFLITMSDVDSSTARPVTAPTETSKPFTLTEMVTPMATIVRIETARAISIRLLGVRKESLRMPKNTISRPMATSMPYLMMKSVMRPRRAARRVVPAAPAVVGSGVATFDIRHLWR